MKVRFSNLFLDCAALTVASTDSICYCLDVLHSSFESSEAFSCCKLVMAVVIGKLSGSHLAVICQPELCSLVDLVLLKAIEESSLYYCRMNHCGNAP